MTERHVDLRVSLAGIHLPNPILTASDCFASGKEAQRFVDIDTIGAVVVKSITRAPRNGLPTPRMVETPSGMLNAIGLQNPGVDAFIEHDLPFLRQYGARVIASIAGDSAEDFRYVAGKLMTAGADTIVGLEVNLSCPNVENRGLVFACQPESSHAVVRAVRHEVSVPVLAKLTSDVTSVVAIAQAVVDAGANGVTLINTLLGMAIDPETGRPELYNTFGGLSGPAIRPVALRNIYQVAQALPTLPILGCGGVQSATDVVQFLRAGATAVSVGTQQFVDPFITERLSRDLEAWLASHGHNAVSDLVATVMPWR